jgi:hypothetical protein
MEDDEDRMLFNFVLEEDIKNEETMEGPMEMVCLEQHDYIDRTHKPTSTVTCTESDYKDTDTGTLGSNSGEQHELVDYMVYNEPDGDTGAELAEVRDLDPDNCCIPEPPIIGAPSAGCSYEAEDIEMFQPLQWFSYTDDTVKMLHDIIDHEVLPTDHICYKLFSDVISYIHTMHFGSRKDRVSWAWNKDVVLFLRTLKKTGGGKSLI